MSLCLDHGHVDARHYPIGMAQDEANIIIERINSQTITEAQLMNTAVNGILSKDARRQFSKLVKQLNVEVTPKDGLFGEVNKDLWGDDGA